MKFYYTYVLLSELDHKFYIGFTTDVPKRLEQHNSGQNISTANRRPFVLIYFEGHLSRTDALRRESYFKTTSGKRTLNLMLENSLSKLQDSSPP